MYKRLPLLLLLLWAALPVRGGVWDSVFLAAENQQLKKTGAIYRDLRATLDSIQVMEFLDSLKLLAGKKGKPELEVASYFYKGVYQLDRVNNVYTLSAIPYLRKSLELANRYKLEKMQISIMDVLGFVLLQTGEKTEGLKLLLQSNKIARKIGYNNLNVPEQHLILLAGAYKKFANYDRAINFGEAALDFVGKRTSPEAETYNLLANIWKEKRETEKALYYYQKALLTATSLGDTLLLATISTNIGQLYILQGEFLKAKEALNKASFLSIKIKSWDCLSFALLSLIEAEIGLNHLQEAKSFRNELIKIMRAHSISDLELLSKYYHLSSRIYSFERQYNKANLFQDSFVQMQDSIYREKDASMLSNLEAQMTAENYMAEKTLLEKENSRQRILRNASWAFSGLTILMLTGLVYSLKARQRRKQRILILEKEKAELEQQKTNERLEHYRHRLSNYISGMREKNRLIERLQQEISFQHLGEHSMANHALVERLYSSIILTEDDWTEFKSVFEKVHPGFIRKMQTDHPDLTVAELRLLLLLKLGLEKQEMASMLGISPESVRKSRQRLRKKLVLDSYKDIPGFIEDAYPAKLHIAG